MVTGSNFPRIYWINLERSQARRLRMERALTTHALQAVRVAALDGQDAAGVERAIHSRAENARVAACLASHLSAIRIAFAAGEELALFMEDDASFELLTRWPGDFRNLFATLSAPWSALWLGYGDSPERLDRLFSAEGMVLPVPSLTLWSTVAYALRRDAMAHLLARYDRGTHFDISSFEDAHEADTLILRSLARAPQLAYPQLLRVPMFTFAGLDSEIHPAELPRQQRARAFVLAAYDALVAADYRPRFGFRARLRRAWARVCRLLGARRPQPLLRASALSVAGSQEARRPSTQVSSPDADSV